MSAPRIHREIQLAANILEMNRSELSKLQEVAEPSTGKVENVAEPLVERILEYVSNLDDSQLEDLHDLYVIEDWRDE